MFFGAAFFEGGFFGGLDSSGKGDNAPARARQTYKPTGIFDRPKLKAKSKVAERLAESAEIHAEVIAEAKQQFLEQPAAPVAMSMMQIDMEIGRLLRKAMRTDDDEVMLLILMAAAVC